MTNINLRDRKSACGCGSPQDRSERSAGTVVGDRSTKAVAAVRSMIAPSLQKGQVMLTTKLAKKVLTKEDQGHLSAVKINSHDKMVRQLRWMVETARTKDYSAGSICRGCWSIGQKLGIVNDKGEINE